MATTQDYVQKSSDGTAVSHLEDSIIFQDDANSRIGIGTNSPSYVVDIAGRSRVRGAGSDGGGLWLTDADAATTNKSFVGRGNNTEDMVGFYTASAWRLAIPDSTGYVGIGTTSPSSLLHVAGGSIYAGGDNSGSTRMGVQAYASGGSTANRALYGVASGTSGSKYGAQVAATGSATNNYGIHVTAQDATNNYAVYAQGDLNYFSGKVGIGTSSPGSNTVRVRSTTADYAVVQSRANSSSAPCFEAYVEYGAEDNYCYKGIHQSSAEDEDEVFAVCKLGNAYLARSVAIDDSSFLQETSPDYKLSVGAKVYVDDATNPSAPSSAGSVVIYFDGSDLWAKRESDGKRSKLTNGGGSWVA